jgi:hypothetical protein
LFVPIFLHGGVIHLMVNTFSLLQLGRNLEGEYGTWRIGLLYLFSGVVGNVVSALFLPTSLTVGASGAIFGLLGGAWADLLQNWSHTPSPCAQLLSLSFSTALNVLLGLMPFLDNFCHLGGLLSGLFIGLVLLVNENNREQRSGKQLLCGQIGLLLSCVSTLLFVVLLYGGVKGASFCPGCEVLNCFPVPGLWSCDKTIRCNVKPNGFTVAIQPDHNGQRFNTTGVVECHDLKIPSAVDQGQINVDLDIVPCATGTAAASSDALCKFRTQTPEGVDECYACQRQVTATEQSVGFDCQCQVQACLLCDPEAVPAR